MTFARTFLSIAALSAATLTASAWAAADDQHDSHHPAQTPAVQVAQATPAKPGMGMGTSAGAAMPGYADQMKAMRDMHDKVLAAKTPDERNALMAEQMKLMQNGMNMMGGMMQSMMQMMMDRMQSVPAAK